VKNKATSLIIAAIAIYAAFIIYRLMKPFKYFSYSEFDSPDLKGSGKNMNKQFVQKLDKIRSDVGFPLKINSGFRTEAYNASLKKSVPNSAHLKGLAADIATPSGKGQKEIIVAALKQGINRIGIGKNFVHLDVDTSKRPNVTWGYGGDVPSFSEVKNWV